MKKISEEINLIFLISKGEKHSRFLVKIADEYKTVLLDNEDGLEAGKTIFFQGIIENADDKWIKKYENYSKSTKNIKKHMVDYKNKCLDLKDLPWGTWHGKRYNHILPLNKKELNMIHSCYYKDLFSYYYDLRSKHEIHPGFANLNSSQAFALNFFVPIIKENLFSKLLKIPEFELIKNTCFEKKLDETEGTQLDFYLETTTSSFTFEVKYSENAFGDAERNEEHLKKYYETYKNKLDEVVGDLSEEEFFEEYQLWRNICFSNKDRYVYFVFPQFRDDLAKKVEDAKNKCKVNFKDNIKILYVDDFVKEMMKSDNIKLREHYTEFYEKYLNIPTI